jgi:hypothetical protein
MATLRKANAYRKVTRAYTRKSKYKKKGFIKAAPNHKIVRNPKINEARIP